MSPCYTSRALTSFSLTQVSRSSVPCKKY